MRGRAHGSFARLVARTFCISKIVGRLCPTEQTKENRNQYGVQVSVHFQLC